MNKRFVIKYTILIGVIAVNIFPGGCLSWGSPPPPTIYPSVSVPTTPLTPQPDIMVSVNGSDYITKLKCIENDATIPKLYKDTATELRVSAEKLLTTSTDGKITIKEFDISRFNDIKNTCDFPALAKTNSPMNY